jgi:uncharacterized glyoxalase superfamily protein PhnB
VQNSHDYARNPSGITPLFIMNNVSATLAFYRDCLGFDITFQAPEPDACAPVPIG